MNQECTLLQNELRKFAQQVILEKVDELDQACSVPFDNLKQLAEMGILGAVIPEDAGGAALDTIGSAVSIEEISKVCASTATIVSAHNAFFAYPILNFGSDDLKQKYLPRAATGEIMGGYADTTTMEIEVIKQGENFVINGKNQFVLNAEANGPIMIFIPTNNQEKMLTAFVLDHDTPGVKKTIMHNVLGLKSAGIGAILFQDCTLTPANIVGAENKGQQVLTAALNLGKIFLSAIALGISQGAIDNAIKYAKERVQFEQTIINFGMVREKIADAATMIEATRLLTYDAAMKRDANENFSQAASMAKYYAGQSAVEITTQSIQIYGGYGYMKDYPVERYFRDAQVINVLCSTPVDEKENIARERIG